MSKIEADGMKLDMEPLDISKTLAESLRVVAGRATTSTGDRCEHRASDLRGADRRAQADFGQSAVHAVKSRPTAARWSSAPDCSRQHRA